jgi:hypothetical protein
MIAMCAWGETYARRENVEGSQDRAYQNLEGKGLSTRDSVVPSGKFPFMKWATPVSAQRLVLFEERELEIPHSRICVNRK